MPVKTAGKIKVAGTNIGVIVTGASARTVRRALRNCGDGDETKKALTFYRVAGRFFATGGRFKRKYTRKKKA